ncbi:nucleotidyltransferase family protein [Qipengyuania sp.]|uniref:nucleotidyltransferase domain-containing protein n=1 Tax=Qipengyuania sp. TaxID=2004515 RepID=UPI0037362AF4
MTPGERERGARLLLALLGHRALEVGADDPTWPVAAELARQQRLGPQGHAALARRPEIRAPLFVADEWRAAHRANAIAILAQRRALTLALAILGEAGIRSVSLKGAALAWTVWPNPADRVMRDLDLLVAPADAPRAYRLLRAAGWAGPDPGEDMLVLMATGETHLPPLMSPDGICLELHAHVWRSPALPGGRMPAGESVALMAGAAVDRRAGARVPAPTDMLAHLVVHGAHAHLFNIGPVLLADIDYLVSAGGIDWPAFWGRAATQGYLRGAALVLALTERWRRPGLLVAAGCPLSPAPAQIALAERLMFQDPAARKEVNLLAGIAATPLRLHRRLARHPLDEAQGVHRGGMPRLVSRSTALLRSLASRPLRRDGLSAAAIARWLDA